MHQQVPVCTGFEKAGVSSEDSWSSTAPVNGQLEYFLKSAAAKRGGGGGTNPRANALSAKAGSDGGIDPRTVHGLSAKTVSDFTRGTLEKCCAVGAVVGRRHKNRARSLCKECACEKLHKPVPI